MNLCWWVKFHFQRVFNDTNTSTWLQGINGYIDAFSGTAANQTQNAIDITFDISNLLANTIDNTCGYLLDEPTCLAGDTVYNLTSIVNYNVVDIINGEDSAVPATIITNTWCLQLLPAMFQRTKQLSLKFPTIILHEQFQVLALAPRSTRSPRSMIYPTELPPPNPWSQLLPKSSSLICSFLFSLDLGEDFPLVQWFLY